MGSFWIFFTRETKHIAPPCSKARFSNFIWNSMNSTNSRFLWNNTPPLVPIEFWILFTRETRHTTSPCNKSRISKFPLEFQGFYKFQISLKYYSPFSSFWIIQKFYQRNLACSATLKWNQNFKNLSGISRIYEFLICMKCYEFFSSYWIVQNFFTRDKSGI